MNITISTDIFAAVSLFRGIEDIRYYLNGLYLETGANGARLVGCDGHQLAVAKLDGEYPEASIILPNSLVAVVKAKAKGPQAVTLEFAEGHQQYKQVENVKGVFVPRDYRRVVPSEVDGTPAQFDPRLFYRIDKACTTLGYKSFTGIAYNGDRSALSVIDENFVVVTMPYKTDPMKTSPAWVQESLCKPEPDRLAA